MRLAIDSNVIFAALIRDSTTRKIFMHLDSEFFVISVNYAEFEEHKKELIKKAKISEDIFELLTEKLFKRCVLVEDRALARYWKEAMAIMDKIDPNDTPFIAAALATGADIWSDDEHFARQKKIKVWKTADLMKWI